MQCNYHTHTMRCGHAAGEDRDYVETAIARGLSTLGFSDHIPMPFSDGHESGYRVPMRLLDDYVTSVLSLREAYRDRIDVRLGFEAEYYPDLFEAMLDLIRPYPVDYLLLAVHFIDSSERVYNTSPRSDEIALVRYVNRCVEGMRTGRYTYLAHPDLFHFTGDPKVYRQEMTRLCTAAKAQNVPLEINLLGLREHKHYPSAQFWEIAGALQCPAVLGCDAHSPQAVADPKNLRDAERFAARFGVRPISDVPLRKPF
ncbi:MAG: histidinol-phosphatase [Clostridia bacterium]|nr:histidinol-phosphatase [Clostridia bacterium]